MDKNFMAWMMKVDAALESVCGLGSSDLPDADYYSMFASGVEPRDAAEQVLEDEGFFDFIDS